MLEAVVFRLVFFLALLVSAMEHYGEQSERKGKANLNVMEWEVLVEEANKHVAELQQRNINITQRNAIWETTFST